MCVCVFFFFSCCDSHSPTRGAKANKILNGILLVEKRKKNEEEEGEKKKINKQPPINNSLVAKK